MNSEIHIDKTGRVSAYVGHDATQLYRARMVKSAIDLYRKSNGRIIPTRGVTITKLLQIAGEYTGQKYKRGEYERAINDLNVWIETMLSALPVVED